VSLYLDSAYIAKCYLNEPDSAPVRTLVRGKPDLTSSAWCRAELACTFLRHVRERALTKRQARELHDLFLDDVRSGAWTLLPVSANLFERVETRLKGLRRRDVFLRAGDAVHLATAADAGFREIWTNDRHLLAAARLFGLRGRSAV
jgi:predicted nucleic acid-binding protein